MKPCLDEYSGQSLEQLLAMAEDYRLDSIIRSIEQALTLKAERIGLANLSEEEQTVLAVDGLEREVNSGGFMGFFSWTPELVPLVVNALNRIECPKTAELTRQAMTAAGIADTRSADVIRSTVDGYNEALEETLNELDAVFWRYEENIEELHFKFISSHRTAISIP